VQCSKNIGKFFVDVNLCQFGNCNQRPIRNCGSCLHESPSPMLCSGRVCSGVQGVNHRRGSGEEEDRALASMFRQNLGLSQREGIPEPPSPSSAAQPSLSSSTHSCAQTPRPGQPSTNFKSSPKSSESKSPVWPSSPVHLSFIAAVTAAFHEWNASQRNSEFYGKGKFTCAQCM